jgi:hypothetical protein
MVPTFPKLNSGLLEQFSLCGRIEDLSGDLAAWIAAESEDKNEPGVGYECRYKVGSRTLWALAIATPVTTTKKPKAHFHIGIAKEESFSESKRKRGAADTREKVERVLERFVGLTFESVWLGSKFKLPTSELPNRGLIDLLLGAEAKVSGTPLVVTGGKAKFTQSETWNEVAWDIDDKNEDLVAIMLEGFRKNVEITKGILLDHEKLFNSGFARYVLEQGGEEDE